MRRLAPAALAATAVLWVGAGLAANVRGADSADVLHGTAGADELYGRAGADRIDARAGPDFLDGGLGPDVLDAGPGADRVSAEQDGARDRIACGDGRDIVTAEGNDAPDAACEVVSVQLSRDATFDWNAQHETEVEPASFGVGRTVVAAYQVGRYSDGGAAAIGFATSRDAGATWRSGVLPGITPESPSPGSSSLAADPSVAYDAVHRWWLVAALVSEPAQGSSLVVSRSRDGLAWSRPFVAAGPDAGDYDKEWIACDSSAGSRFRGRCYLSYLNLRAQRLETRFSTDGGRSWSPPALISSTSAAAIVNGAQPLPRPDGTVVVVFSAFDGVFDSPQNAILAARSTNGGVSFGTVTRVAALFEEDVRGIRAPPLPSATVDRFGTLYVAWSDCRFRPDCEAGDVVVATSRDGRTWAGPRRVPTVPPAVSSPDVFLPAIGVDPTSPRGRARVAVVYHTQPQAGSCGFGSCPGVDVWTQRSDDGGLTWRRPQLLSARPMPLHWMAEGGIGAMLGDYVALSWAGGRPVPVFALASPPVAGTLRQSIFAVSRLR